MLLKKCDNFVIYGRLFVKYIRVNYESLQLLYQMFCNSYNLIRLGGVDIFSDFLIIKKFIKIDSYYIFKPAYSG